MELFLEISSSKYIVKTSEYPVLDRGITNGTVTCDVILQTGKLTLGKTPWSSGKGEDSCPRGCEFESRPAVETIYHAPLIWIKSMKAKIVEK